MQIKLLSFTICTLITIVSCNLKTEDFQYKDMHDLQNFLISLDLSTDGFHHFVSQVYNNGAYARDFLPNNFDHMAQFLEYGLKSHQSRMYEQQVIRLFADKLKGASYVNSLAFSAILQKIPSLLEPYFVEPKLVEVHVLQENINALLYNNFLQKFSLFKENPESFLDELTTEIICTLGNREQGEDISIEELRKTMMIFLEGALSKLIWCPADLGDTWKSVKTVAQQLAVLRDHGIITDVDDLNSLYITLIERYCFFIDVVSFDMPSSFYQEIKGDINTNIDHCLFAIQEQDDLIQSKKDRLIQAITQAEGQAQELRSKELAVIA